MKLTKKQQELLDRIKAAGELRYWMRVKPSRPNTQFVHYGVGVHYITQDVATKTADSLIRLGFLSRGADGRVDEEITYRTYFPA